MLKQAKEIIQTNGGKTVLLAVGAVVLAPTVVSLLKPVAKATIKTGVILLEKGKESIAETGEQLGDLVAEAKAEVAAEQAKVVTQVPEDPTPTEG